MSAIPPNVVENPVAELAKWYALKKRIAAECTPLIAQERAMRQRLFTHFFPEPVEGTNNFTLPDGYVVKGKYPIDREVDAGMVATLRGMKLADLEPAFRQQLNLHGAPDAMPVLEALRLSVDSLLKWEPDLVVKEYRKLTAEQRIVFDRCLSIKPGSLTLEVAPPSTRAAAPQAMGFNGPESA